MVISHADFIRGMAGRWSDASGILKFHLKKKKKSNETEFTSLFWTQEVVLLTVSSWSWLTQCTWRCRTVPTHALTRETSSYLVCRRPSCRPGTTMSELRSTSKPSWSYHGTVLCATSRTMMNATAATCIVPWNLLKRNESRSLTTQQF